MLWWKIVSLALIFTCSLHSYKGECPLVLPPLLLAVRVFEFGSHVFRWCQGRASVLSTEVIEEIISDLCAYGIAFFQNAQSFLLGVAGEDRCGYHENLQYGNAV